MFEHVEGKKNRSGFVEFKAIAKPEDKLNGISVDEYLIIFKSPEED